MRRSLLTSLLVGALVLLALALAAATWGGPQPPPSLTIDPTTWSPTATVGTPTTQTFTITYSGKGNSGRLASGYGGTGAIAFATTSSTCEGVTLSAKQPTCQMTVRFAPTSATTYPATLNVSGRKVSTGATLNGTGQAATLPTLSIDDPERFYSGSITFTVTMSSSSTTAVTFDWQTADDTSGKYPAVSGTSCDESTDYFAASGTGTIAAGETSYEITIDTCSNGPGNMSGESTTFTLTISNPAGATITKATGTATNNPT